MNFLLAMFYTVSCITLYPQMAVRNVCTYLFCIEVPYENTRVVLTESIVSTAHFSLSSSLYISLQSGHWNTTDRQTRLRIGQHAITDKPPVGSTVIKRKHLTFSADRSEFSWEANSLLVLKKFPACCGHRRFSVVFRTAIYREDFLSCLGQRST